MNELDKLRYMMMRSKIPFESYQEHFNDIDAERYQLYYGYTEARYVRNQIIYGRLDESQWKSDAICQMGSYGAEQGLIECYGSLGSENGNPRVMTAEEAYRIIEKDWRTNNG